MYKMYCLASDDEVLYVGKTTTSLKVREWHHRGKWNGCNSKCIPEGTVWQMIHLEDVSEEDSTAAERFYIDFLEPKYNKVIPGRTVEEYEQSDERKKYNKERMKRYEQTDKCKEIRKRYYLKKKSIRGVE